MGSTYSVTSFPQQLYPGWQHTVTIINQGPNSVWIDSDASVNVVTSFRLRPNGVVTWEAKKPLWAVTEDLKNFEPTSLFNPYQRVRGARLAVMDGALASHQNFPVNREIAKFPASTNGPATPFTALFETSGYRAIRVNFAFEAAVVTVLTVYVTSWTDERTPLVTDEYALIYSPSMSLVKNILSMQVPVLGAYTSISVTNPINHNYRYVSVSGYSDSMPVELCFRSDEPSATYGSIVLGMNDPAGVTSIGSTHRNIWLDGWNGRGIHLPSMGERLTINYSYVSGPAGNRFTVYNAASQAIYYTPVAFNPGEFGQVTIDVHNTSMLIVETWLVTTDMDARFSWTNQDNTN